MGLIPLLLAKGEPGKEVLYPIGVVISGGIVIKAFMDMILTPVMFYTFGGPAVEKFLKEEKGLEKVEEGMVMKGSAGLSFLTLQLAS